MARWASGQQGTLPLSVLDELGRQILKVGMLHYGTVKAGTNGDILARTMTDLVPIAASPDMADIPGSEIGLAPDRLGTDLSPLPWSFDYGVSRR